MSGAPTNALVYVRLTTWQDFTNGPNVGFSFSQTSDMIFNDDRDEDGIRDAIDPNPGLTNPKTVRSGTNYTLTILGSGRVASLQVAPALFDAYASQMNYSDYPQFTKMLYQQFNDDFDFIFLTWDQSAPPVYYYSGAEIGVRYMVQGLGNSLPLRNNTASFGSAGKLQGAMHLTTWDAIQHGPSLHELLHQWANNLDTNTFPQSGGSVAQGHWGAASVNGTLGGFDSNSLVNLGGGLYQVKKFALNTGSANTTPYAPLELYCAGMIPAADVPDTKIAIGFTGYAANSSTTATFNASYISNVPVATIVAANGARIPDSTNSQKRFKLLHVTVCKAPLSNPSWATLDQETYYFGLAGTNNEPPLLNFWQATGGRGTLDVTNLTASLQSATTSLVTLVASPTNGGTVAGGGSYLSGSNITISATANGGFQFVNWNDANTNASRSIIVPSANIAYTANFSVVVGPSPLIVTGATVVLTESCTPTNGVVDPIETVTLNFALRNAGSADATNVTATLLTNGSALYVGGPQNYGALTAGGSTVSRPFTFTAIGSCGGAITNTFQISDGATSLGTVSFVRPLGVSGVIYAENFDGVTAPALPAGWSSAASGTQPSWVTTATTPDSAPNAAYSADSGNIGINELVTPAIAVASVAATLSFRNKYDTDYDTGGYYDGGVLEIKIGSGSFTDILAAGGSFQTNGYTATLQSPYGNPLGSRQAWSGLSAGYLATIVSLPSSAAGQNVQFRWRFGSDNSISAGGWWIDSIALNDRSCCTPQPPNIVRLAQASATNLTVQSVGNGVYPLTADYTTNLIGAPNWQPAIASTVWNNGTNTTTFTAPANANPAFIRVKQAVAP